MKAIMVAGTVITNKAQAIRLVKKLNNETASGSFEAALAVDEMIETLVNAGLITWEEVDEAF